MKFLNNIKLKSKLLLLVVFPLAGLLYFSGLSVYNSYTTGVNVQKANDLVDMSVKISALVHETQKERGMTAGYLGSKGKKFKNELPAQRELTNNALQAFISYDKSMDYSTYPNRFKTKVSDIITSLDGLNNIRSQVDSVSISTANALGFYTNNNTKLLSIINSSVKLSKVAAITKDIAAYSAFLHSKERAGIERAVGTNTLALDKFGPNMRSKFINLIAAQNSYLETFQGYSTPAVNSYYDKKMVGSDIDEVNRIRKVIIEADEFGGMNIEAEYWFDIITKKINLLKKVENYIRDNLEINNQNLKYTVAAASSISNLLHETQKERGATAGFIGSKGKKFAAKLPQQRKLTDERIAIVEKNLKTLNRANQSKEFNKYLNEALDKLSQLKDMRAKVSALSIPAGKAIGYYTSVNAAFLDTIAAVSKMATTANESKNLAAFYNFLMSKERAGIERAVLSNTFARNKFLPGMKKKFTVLVTEQNSYLKSFKSIAKPSFTNFYNNTLKGKAVDEVNAMRKIAFDAKTIGGFGEDPNRWFGHITKKINKLKEVDDWLSNRLIVKLQELKSIANTNMYIDLIASIFIHLIVAFMSFFITTGIINNLNKFKTGLGYFFKYAVREKDYLKPMDVVGTDEFAQMTLEMNEGISKTAYIIEQDKKVVMEIDDVMRKITNGFFTYSIHTKGATNEMEALRHNINGMLESTKQKLNYLNEFLDNYGKGNYSFRLDHNKLDGMCGNFGNITTGMTALGHDISSFMAMFSNALDSLNKNTGTLTSSAQSLSESSNVQAASLEETAAAVEQITGNIKSSGASVAQMANISDDVIASANLGQELAGKTATSMDSIGSEVNAIADAITVIDQIAFQTNILSLNAAVEAATAGEAGKGFAVVAQEVRNLAARSAEAAKEIKDLVESANSKAKDGKAVADEMINGYEVLTEKIGETKTIINDVATSSKEQEIGITQINDAINGLDKVTQQNASSANQIDNLSVEISNLADKISEIMEQASFDEEIKNQVCDVELLRSVSNYKTDHVKFKSTNFDKLDEFTSFKVTDHNNCNLGKWINDQERNGIGFTQSTAWKKLKDIHLKVHGGVQNYIDKNANKADNETLVKIARSIEDDTVDVFDSLNGVLISHCKYNKEDLTKAKEHKTQAAKKAVQDIKPATQTVVKPKNQVPVRPKAVKAAAIKPKVEPSKPIVSNNNDDEWESF